MCTRLLILLLILSAAAPATAQGEPDASPCRSGDDALHHHLEQGGLARGSQRYEQAFDEYNCALAIDADSVVALSGRALVHIASGRYEDALADLEQAIALREDDPLLHNNRGVAYRGLGMHTQALIHFNRAIDLDPAYAVAYNNRAIVYQNLGEQEAAVEDFLLAAELGHPEPHVPYMNLAQVHRLDDEPGEALRYLQQAVRLSPSHAPIYLLLGDLYLEQGNTAEAERSYRQYIQMTSGNAIELLDRLRYAGWTETLKRLLPALIAGGILLLLGASAVWRAVQRRYRREIQADLNTHQPSPSAEADTPPSQGFPALLLLPVLAGVAVILGRVFGGDRQQT